MENLEKMASLIGDMFYKVFDLIWTLTIPGTDIRIIIFPLIMLVINLVIGGILGIHIERPKVGFRKKYRKSVANWGAKKKSSSGPIKKFSGHNSKNRPWVNQHGRRIKR
ncbi:hypothetical protein [Spiroplasma endosymbiont of 'Nebria riversi']|uniref:hypothetical protein n=1 Tax=Spiroplasma endosymbiont of 'Nebria riversi' TaxID=2792084 RepID=UPI001C04906F|nr:hypothetical protein [Spiroplasma endosymbiont of 'Nebria riversi']